MSEVEEKEVTKTGGIGYVGRRLSAKEIKRLMLNATPEQRKIWVELMPKPQKRYG